uniref:Uncharacterized protein n=1 Tax=Solanum lycopersicum TaxID=4081 RepID=K4CS00_SOLLC
MPRSRINGNFIDKTFSILADILLRVIPTTFREKEAFTHYRDGLYTLTIWLIHTSNGEHTKDLEYYFQALERNPFLPQAFNNMAVIRHYVYGIDQNGTPKGLTTESYKENSEIVEAWFDQAAEYWKHAIALTPGIYIKVRNWLKIMRRFE